MTASLKTGGRYHIHPGLFQGNRFVHCCRRSNQCNPSTAELIQNLLRGNSINEAECGNSLVEENLYLVFEANRFVWLIGRPRTSYTFNMLFQWRKAAMKVLLRRSPGSFVFHRHP